MFTTWMLATTMWMTREDAPDPFRMEDEQQSAQVLTMPARDRLPHEPKALVA